MNYKQIVKLQKTYGASAYQESINSGQVWLLEGSSGRHAVELLRSGVCMLPLLPYRDYYGNTVPARIQVKPGTTGSFKNCADFWQRVNDGDDSALETLNCI